MIAAYVYILSSNYIHHGKWLSWPSLDTNKGEGPLILGQLIAGSRRLFNDLEGT